jgi:hypothetical protein
MKKNQKAEYIEKRRAIREVLRRLETAFGWTSPWQEQFRENIEEVGRWTKRVLKENQHLLKEWRESLPTEDDLVLLEHTEDLMKKAGREGKYEDFLRLTRLYHAWQADMRVKDFLIRLESEPEEFEESAEDLYNAFVLGLNYAFGVACEVGKYPENLLLKALHSALSAWLMKLKRWEPEKAGRQALLDEVRAKAEEYYQGGGTERHHVVARLFHNEPEYGDKFSKISLEKIRKVVGEVAIKYGLKSGLPKTESP